jgi:phage terminase small subunit
MIVAGKLTPKQMRFCDEYLADTNMNATQAAIKAGYAKKRASEQGYQLLQKTTVKEYIQKRMAERVERTEITQDKVLRELAIIAFSNAADYARVVEKEATIKLDDGDEVRVLDDEGKPVMYRTVEPILTDSLTVDQQRALAVIKKGRDGFEVRPYDKVRALELLGKHIGMFKDKVEVSGDINNPMEGLSTEDLKKLIYDG